MSLPPPLTHVANFMAATTVGIPNLAVVTEAQKRLGKKASLAYASPGLIEMSQQGAQTNIATQNEAVRHSADGNAYGPATEKEPKAELKMKISIFTIVTLIIGALLFIAIISWFDFLHILYDETFITGSDPTKPFRYYGTSLRLGYALLVTSITGVISVILWHYFL